MRFTLTYDGVLPPTATATIKQEIREVFHPQIKELWSHEPLVLHRDQYLAPDDGSGHVISVLTHFGGHVFAPLICSRLHLLGELSIEMLRPEPPGSIITNQGDIDSRLKTLFDALRTPGQNQEVKPGAMPTSTDPVFTLLDDDRLITRVSVDTDRLLAPPHPSPHYTRLTIRVNVRPSKMIVGNMNLIA